MARNLCAWAYGREQHNDIQKAVNLQRREMLWKKAFSTKGSISPFLLSRRASGCDCKKMCHMKMVKVIHACDRVDKETHLSHKKSY